MRVLPIGVVVLVAVPFAAAAAAGGSAAPEARARCARPTTSLRLPAGLTARTKRGFFTIGREGTTCRLPFAPYAVPANAAWWQNGTWVEDERGHILVGRWQRTIWRSADRVPHASAVGAVAIDHGRLVFSTFWRASRLYLATRNGRAQLVSRGETPLGWTTGGLYVARDRDGAIFLRDGSRVRRIPRANTREAAYAASGHRLYFVARDRLVQASGMHRRVVAELSAFGLQSSRSLELQAIGRLLALQNRRRLVVLRADGSLFASTELPQTRHALVSASPTPAPDGRAVAFSVLVPDRRIETQVIERGVETVYLLRHGMSSAAPIHVERMRFNVCGHGADLSWRGQWLLYATGEGDAAVIDTHTGGAIELTSLVRRLPGFSGVEESGPLSLGWG